MADTIRVGIADMKICKAPDLITTVGLGSCIGVVLYDDIKKICGLLHIMLPDSTRIKHNSNIYKFADTGIASMISELEKQGVNRGNLKAKMAGGAQMFSFSNGNDINSIGEQNIKAVHDELAKYKIKVKSEDVGLNFGRTIIFNPETSELEIIKAGKQKKTI